MTNSQVRKNKSAQDSATDISTVSLVTDGIVESFLSDWMLGWKISVNHPNHESAKIKNGMRKKSGLWAISDITKSILQFLIQMTDMHRRFISFADWTDERQRKEIYSRLDRTVRMGNRNQEGCHWDKDFISKCISLYIWIIRQTKRDVNPGAERYIRYAGYAWSQVYVAEEKIDQTG